jgi:hypothetical protein
MRWVAIEKGKTYVGVTGGRRLIIDYFPDDQIVLYKIAAGGSGRRPVTQEFECSEARFKRWAARKTDNELMEAPGHE